MNALRAAALLALLTCGTARAQHPAPASAPAPAPAAPAAAPAPEAPPVPPPGEPVVTMDPGALDRATRDGSSAADGVADAWAMMVKSMVALAGVLLLVYLIVGKGLGKLAQKQGQGRALRVVDRVGLDPRKTLYLVEVDGVRTLVAATDHAVSMLVLPDNPAPARAADSPAGDPAPASRGDA